MNEKLFNPNGINRSTKETTKERNARRKAEKRLSAITADRAKTEAQHAARYESHLQGRIMKDLERIYGRGFTRGAGNMNRVLTHVMLNS